MAIPNDPGTRAKTQKAPHRTAPKSTGGGFLHPVVAGITRQIAAQPKTIKQRAAAAHTQRNIARDQPKIPARRQSAPHRVVSGPLEKEMLAERRANVAHDTGKAPSIDLGNIIRHFVEPRRGIIPTNESLGAELHGKGTLTGGLAHLGATLEHLRAGSTGLAPGILRPPTAATHLSQEGDAQKIVKHIIPGLLNLPAQTAASITVPVEDVLSGHPKRLGKDVGDPLLQTFEHPWRSFVKDPVPTLMILHGGVEAAGRTAGAVLRHGPSGTLRKAASQTRPDKTIGSADQTTTAPNARLTGLRYSPNVLKKAAQVSGEKAHEKILANQQRTRQEELRQSLAGHLRKADIQTIEGDHTSAALSRQHAARADKEIKQIDKLIDSGALRHRMTQGQAARFMRAEADRDVGKLEHLRRSQRHTAVNAVLRNLPRLGGRLGPVDERAANLVPLIGEKIVRSPKTLKEDLVAEQKRLSSTTVATAHDADLNRAKLELVERALHDPALIDAKTGEATPRALRAFKSADKIEPHMAAIENNLIALGHMTREQVDRAKLVPYAVLHMGAEYSRARLPTAVQSRHLAARDELDKAKGLLRDAEKAHRSAREKLAHERGRKAQLHARATRVSVEAADRRFAEAQHRVHVARAAVQHAKDVRNEMSKRAKIARPLPHERRYYQQGFAKDGQSLTTEEIRQHMAENGVHGTPFFLSHRSPGDSAFFRDATDTTARPLAEKKRTGAAVKQGTYASDFHALIASHARAQSLSSALEGMNYLVSRWGITKPDGTYFRTRGDAEHAAHGFAHDIGPDNQSRRIKHVPELVPMRVAHMFETADRLKAAKQDMNPGTIDDLAKSYASNIEDAFKAGDGPFVLVPKEVANQLQKHQKLINPGDEIRAIMSYTQRFRHTVLPLSMRWLAGNVIEAMFRTASAGAGPVSFGTGKILLRKMDRLEKAGEIPEGAVARLRAAAGQGHVSGQIGLDRRTSASRYNDPFLHRLSTIYHSIAGAGVGKVKPFRAVGRIWEAAARDRIIDFNRWFERQHETAVFGKVARREVADVKSLSDSWLHSLVTQRGVLEDLARGIAVDTNRMHAYARASDEVLGKYSNLSPRMKRAVSTYAPFMAWYRNAIKFVYHDFPLKRPIQQAAVAGAYEGTKERQAKEGVVPATVPLLGDLRKTFLAGVPVVGGKKIDYLHYLPFSAAQNPLAVGVAQLAPQANVLGTFSQGLDFKGDPITTGNVSGLEAAIGGVYQMFESIMPGVRLARTIREGGATPYGDSMIWHLHTKTGKRTLAGGINRAFNPVRALGGTKPASSGGSSGLLGTGSSGGGNLLGGGGGTGNLLGGP